MHLRSLRGIDKRCIAMHMSSPGDTWVCILLWTTLRAAACISTRVPMQGEPLSSWLHVRVLRIRDLQASDRAVPAAMLTPEGDAAAEERDGVAIEINSPLSEARSRACLSCMCSVNYLFNALGVDCTYGKRFISAAGAVDSFLCFGAVNMCIWASVLPCLPRPA